MKKKQGKRRMAEQSITPSPFFETKEILKLAGQEPEFAYAPDQSTFIKNGDKFMIWVPMAFCRRKNMDDLDEVENDEEFEFNDLTENEQEEVRDFFSIRSSEFLQDFEGYVFDQLTKNSDRNGGTSWDMQIITVKVDGKKNELYMATKVVPTSAAKLARTKKMRETMNGPWIVRQEKVPIDDVINQIQEGLAKQTSGSEYPYFRRRDSRKYKQFGRYLFVFLDGIDAVIIRQ